MLFLIAMIVLLFYFVGVFGNLLLSHVGASMEPERGGEPDDQQEHADQGDQGEFAAAQQQGKGRTDPGGG